MDVDAGHLRLTAVVAARTAKLQTYRYLPVPAFLSKLVLVALAEVPVRMALTVAIRGSEDRRVREPQCALKGDEEVCPHPAVKVERQARV